jgi:hypothetical protein
VSVRAIAFCGVALELFGVVSARAKSLAGAPLVLHDPAKERRAENGILRPLPLDVELPPDVDAKAARVLVHYRLWGDPDWSAIELRRVVGRHHGAIPCLEVGTITGDLKYYVRVHDVGGRVIATGASRALPYRVSIRHETTLGAEAAKAAKCPEPADCPRGLLGCPSERVLAVQCARDLDCEDGSTCGFEGVCEKVVRPRNAFSLSFSQEAGALDISGGCSLPAQEGEGFACFRDDGAPYIGNPAYVTRPVATGLGMTRVVVGYDRLLNRNASLGVRVGLVVADEARMARGAAPLVPVSAAVRGSYAFGTDPHAETGLRPYAFLTAGYGQFDVRTRTTVREIPSAPSFQGGNDLIQDLAIHRRAGDAFVGVGLGVGYVVTPAIVPSLELTVVDAFPFGAVLVVASAGAVLAS